MKPVRGILILSLAALVACAGEPVTPSESSDLTIPSGDISSSQVSSSEVPSSSESNQEPVPSSSESSSASSSSSIEPYTGYYQNISTTSTGATLKTELYNLIKGHTQKSYDFAWTAYQTTDLDENGKIIDMYSNYHYSPSQHSGNYQKEGDIFNREHTVPQMVFGSGTPKSDLHHLLPTDGKVNGVRNNYPHAEVTSPTYTSTNGCKLGTSITTGYTGTAFEVPDQYKGDFARIYFYMVTRYQNLLTDWANFPAFSKNTYPSLSSWAITLYLKWSDMDPVSEKEIKRNDAVFVYQKNRNPFVDHPEFAHRIWDSAK